MTKREQIELELKQIGGLLLTSPYDEDLIDLLHDLSILLQEASSQISIDLCDAHEYTLAPRNVIEDARRSVAWFMNH